MRAASHVRRGFRVPLSSSLPRLVGTVPVPLACLPSFLPADRPTHPPPPPSPRRPQPRRAPPSPPPRSLRRVSPGSRAAAAAPMAEAAQNGPMQAGAGGGAVVSDERASGRPSHPTGPRPGEWRARGQQFGGEAVAGGCLGPASAGASPEHVHSASLRSLAVCPGLPRDCCDRVFSYPGGVLSRFTIPFEHF